jgi:hypothetical protein
MIPTTGSALTGKISTGASLSGLSGTAPATECSTAATGATLSGDPAQDKASLSNLDRVPDGNVVRREQATKIAARPPHRGTLKPRPTGPTRHQEFLSSFRQIATFRTPDAKGCEKEVPERREHARVARA